MLETLTPLAGDRKCFRMINGVLVERTVSDVLPGLQTNADGLKKVLDDLVKQYRAKQDEMEKWKVCRGMARTESGRAGGRADDLGRRRIRCKSCSSERCESRGAARRVSAVCTDGLPRWSKTICWEMKTEQRHVTFGHCNSGAVTRCPRWTVDARLHAPTGRERSRRSGTRDELEKVYASQ